MQTKTALVEATRQNTSLLAAAERRLLVSLAAKLPPWILPDHLTALGLLAMVLSGVCYALSPKHPAWIHGASLGLVLNWFGDSLDGTLARHRQRLRPRYGFYVDHIVDAFGSLFLLAGLAASGLMSVTVALSLLVAYYLVSIQMYLSTYALRIFQLSFGPFGGTELRLMLILVNTLAVVWPTVSMGLIVSPLFDLVAVPAIVGLFVTAVLTTIRNTRVLFDLDRLPPVAD